MDAIELRTTCAPTDCGVTVPSNATVTTCPILTGNPHSARSPLVEMLTSVALKPGGEIRRPLIDGTADAGRRRAGECSLCRDDAVGSARCGKGTVAIYESSRGEGGFLDSVRLRTNASSSASKTGLSWWSVALG